MTRMTERVFAVAVLGIISLSISFLPNITEAAVKDWQKSASIYTYNKNGFDSAEFKESLKAWRATGANYISLVIPYYQKDKTSSEILPKSYAPSDETLAEAINYAHSIGLKVMLKVHVTSDDNEWQAYISAADRKAWFASYSAMLNHLADIAEKSKAEEICIGTELASMTTYTSNPENTEAWINMIDGVRERYSGLLTYSANWGGSDFTEEASHIGFWNHLDYIGISAYFQLAKDVANPKTSDFVNSWKYWDEKTIKPLHDAFQKPIIFTEVGYRSVPEANGAPYDGAEKGGIDLELQANLYQALFQYWNGKAYMAGIHIWDWKMDPLEGGPGNNQYTVHFKPAENVLKKWFASSIKTTSANIHSIIGKPLQLNLGTTTTLIRGPNTFQAYLPERLNYTYATSWQVDGGSPIWMNDNLNQYIYEESLLDTSMWRWNGNGPYRVTFTAREFAENGDKIIGQRTINLYLKP
jgi:hypothetical protein